MTQYLKGRYFKRTTPIILFSFMTAIHSKRCIAYIPNRGHPVLVRYSDLSNIWLLGCISRVSCFASNVMRNGSALACCMLARWGCLRVLPCTKLHQEDPIAAASVWSSCPLAWHGMATRNRDNCSHCLHPRCKKVCKSRMLW